MTLRRKFSLLTAGIVVLTLGVFGALLLWQMESALRRGILDGARAVSSTAAEAVAAYLDDGRSDIRAVVAGLPPEAVVAGDVPVLESRLREAFAAYPLFDAGFWVLDGRGRLLCGYPPTPTLPGSETILPEKDLATMRGGHAPLVFLRSEPPMMSFTMALRTAEGTFAGVLGGNVALDGPGSLGGIGEERFGQAGYLFIFDRSRQIILHPDRGRILRRDIPPGANPLLDRAIEGAEAAGETTDIRGVRMLAAFHRVPGTDWIVGVQQPAAEAFAPLKEARKQSGIFALYALLLAVALTGWAMMRVTRPLERLQRAVLNLRPAAGTALRPPEEEQRLRRDLENLLGRDEIGQLAAAFEALYDRLDENLQDLHRANERWERTFNAVHDPILILGPDRRVRRINTAAADLFGTDRSAAVGRDGAELVHGTAPPPSNSPFLQPGTDPRVIPGPELNPSLTGTYEILTNPLHDDAGTLLGRVYVLHDITSRQEAEDHLKRLTYFDPLTDLPNRALLRERLDRHIEQVEAAGTGLAVAILDLDRFKAINDTLGNRIGDRLLARVADRLRGAVQPRDTVARLGSDEFALVFHDVAHGGQAAAIGRRLLAVLAQPLELDGGRAEVTASIGLALFPEHGRDPATLLKSADLAMYAAKEAGRNTQQLFAGEVGEKARQRLSLGSNLRHALDRNELTLRYQPQVDLVSGRVTGFEALARWENLELGKVPPGRFVPLAEENGLIVPIGQWLLRTACSELRRLRANGHPELRLSVNLSPLQLRTAGFADMVLQILEECHLPADSLELELTETAILADVGKAAEQLKRLRDEGVTVALDDFGTGYSSIQTLKQLPLDRLKIDRSFVRDLEFDVDDSSIVEVIVAIAGTLGLEVVAEGVDTEQQLAYLRECGCQMGQGYLFGRPLPETAVADFLDSFRMPEAPASES